MNKSDFNPRYDVAAISYQNAKSKTICFAFFVFTIFSTPIIILITMPLSIANFAYIVRNEILLNNSNISFTYNRGKNETPLYTDCFSSFSEFVISANKATLYLQVAFYSFVILVILTGLIVHSIITCIKNKRFVCQFNRDVNRNNDNVYEFTPYADENPTSFLDFLDRLFSLNINEQKGLLIFAIAIVWPFLTPILLSIHWRIYTITNRCASDPIYKDQDWHSSLDELKSNHGVCVGLNFAGLIICLVYFVCLILFGLIISKRRT